MAIPAHHAKRLQLVDDRVQSRHARVHPECRAGRSLLSDAGPHEERGRVRGHLLRTNRAAEWGVELGADRPEWPLRGPRALLRSPETVVRQDLAADGPRADRLTNRSLR